MKRQAGFTITEVLVALIICCLVTTVIFPRLFLSRISLDSETCASNERQIGRAIFQYVQDNDGALPNRLIRKPGTNWKQLLLPYIDNPKAFSCPSNPCKNVHDGESSSVVSYAANSSNDGTRPFLDSDTGNQYVLLSSVVSPNHTVAITETTSIATDFNVTAPSYFANPGKGAGDYKGHLFAGHDKLSNFLFIDGHVQCLDPIQTLDHSDGGEGEINMWTNNNDSFVETSADGHIPVGDATGATVLMYPHAAPDIGED